ncbi:hypothetical protein RCL_jg2648.t1 [Rhizophagus clarus]|uniref:Uncharacterized protein n=1 Tax=Rhizophagus clarus TaxID=94130 RepID=A0A8H3LGF8_9GLOM|nr:hypothetical protein RCL_jg2648.t1 [Rhizophagus clarus]
MSSLSENIIDLEEFDEPLEYNPFACNLAGPDVLEASHSDVDLETDPFIQPIDLQEYSHKTEYLAAMNTRFPYPNHIYTCGGKPKIKCYLIHATNQWSEFVGCGKWK